MRSNPGYLLKKILLTYCHGQFFKDHVDMRKRAEILAVASKFWTLQIRSSLVKIQIMGGKIYLRQ